MNSFLSCEYSLDILPVIVAFVRSSASVCGASELELSSFELAAEETAAHVIENFPDPTPNDRFSISCRDCDNGVEFNFENRGVPMNPEIILQYDLTDIDEYQLPTKTEWKFSAHGGNVSKDY